MVLLTNKTTGDSISAAEYNEIAISTNAVTPKILPINNLSGTNTGDQDLTSYAVKSGSLTQFTTRSHTDLSNIGTNTHAQIDTHIGSTSNPHSVTATQIGLGNVANVNTTTTANISDSTNKRFVTDVNLTTIAATTGTNTGDQNLSAYAVKTELASAVSAITSGAYSIGVFDEFTNSSSSNVQDVLDDLDAAITTVAGGGITGAANIGVGGVGVFKEQSGLTLNFKNVNSGSSKVTITNDVSNNEIDIDVSEANLTHNNIGGTLSVTKGGTGRTTGTTAYCLVATGTTATGAEQSLANGATTTILVGGGASALPVWTTATGSGAPVRETSPTLTTPNIGIATATTVTLNPASSNPANSEGKIYYNSVSKEVKVYNGTTWVSVGGAILG